MKHFLGLFWILVLITVIVHFGSSKIIAKREESNYENGTDVVVVKPGLLDIVLTGPNLTFEVCANNCGEEFLVCYEPASVNQSGLLEYCDSECGYYVDANDDSISFMFPLSQDEIGIARRERCYTATMRNGETTIYPKGDGMYSCDPKIENGVTQLNITIAGSKCPVIIKNAKLYKEEAPATNPSSPESSNTPAPPSDSSAPTSKLIENYFEWFFVLFTSFYLFH